MDRAAYNACMSPYIKGKGKSKDERKRDFCIGAKICSSKASSREEALQMCPITIPKRGQQVLPQENDNPCTHIIHMRDWIQQPDDKICRPCLLGPVIQWYRDELQAKGLNDLAIEVEGAIEGGEITMATKLDEIKSKVSPELKARLREFDCYAQIYKGEEDGN